MAEFQARGEPGQQVARVRSGRIAGIDGIRGIAALFVVLHHCYLVSFPGYPRNTGPHWTAWLLFGHMSVAVFIVVSGFSLAVAPARRQWQLGGIARFAHRRAWRILPPYWAALLFSLVMAWAVTPQPDTPEPTARTVVVYGLLVQDVFGAPSPNGAFWSIAIEAQLYAVFPILLLIVRRSGAAAMIAATSIVVVTIGLLAQHVAIVGLLTRLTPQFAVLFALGLAAAGVLVTGQPRRPWHWFALAAAVPVLVTIVLVGSVRWDANMFWADLAIGPAVATLLAAVATGRPAWLVRALDTRLLRKLGLFSYSLYLIHAPIVVAVNDKIVGQHARSGLTALWMTLAVAVPLAVVVAWSFSKVFEIPFQRYRSWAALRAAIDARLARLGLGLGLVRRAEEREEHGEVTAPEG